jgi:hypothetical protein
MFLVLEFSEPPTAVSCNKPSMSYRRRVPLPVLHFWGRVSGRASPLFLAAPRIAPKLTLIETRRALVGIDEMVILSIGKHEAQPSEGVW